jgi:hypothetical protein
LVQKKTLVKTKQLVIKNSTVTSGGGTINIITDQIVNHQIYATEKVASDIAITAAKQVLEQGHDSSFDEENDNNYCNEENHNMMDYDNDSSSDDDNTGSDRSIDNDEIVVVAPPIIADKRNTSTRRYVRFLTFLISFVC